MSIKLNFGIVREVGITPQGPHGVYYPRNLMYLPAKGYCVYVLRKWVADNETRRRKSL